MKRLVNIENPSIIITAPDELINEVGGNCYQIGGSQPLTYAKNLWRLEEINIPKGIDEVAEELANEHGFIKHPSFKPAKYSYQAVRDVFIEAAKAGAALIAGQGVEAYCIKSFNPVSESPDKPLHGIEIIYEEIDGMPYVLAGDKIIIQIRKAE